MAKRFRNRADAGRRLAELLQPAGLSDPVVLALPRGGVPVAVEVARSLGVPFDVFVARKIGMPGHVEFGIGAIAEGEGLVVNAEVLSAVGISQDDFASLVEEERLELERRVSDYRGGRALPDLAGRDVVLVDDGLATGVTAEAALTALRMRAPRRLVLAVPVSAQDSARRLAGIGNEVVSVITPGDFRAVGSWYDDFDQTTDDEVIGLLSAYGPEGRSDPSPSGRDADGPQNRGEPHG